MFRRIKNDVCKKHGTSAGKAKYQAAMPHAAPADVKIFVEKIQSLSYVENRAEFESMLKANPEYLFTCMPILTDAHKQFSNITPFQWLLYSGRGDCLRIFFEMIDCESISLDTFRWLSKQIEDQYVQFEAAGVSVKEDKSTDVQAKCYADMGRDDAQNTNNNHYVNESIRKIVIGNRTSSLLLI